MATTHKPSITEQSITIGGVEVKPSISGSVFNVPVHTWNHDKEAEVVKRMKKLINEHNQALNDYYKNHRD